MAGIGGLEGMLRSELMNPLERRGLDKTSARRLFMLVFALVMLIYDTEVQRT